MESKTDSNLESAPENVVVDLLLVRQKICLWLNQSAATQETWLSPSLNSPSMLLISTFSANLTSHRKLLSTTLSAECLSSKLRWEELSTPGRLSLKNTDGHLSDLLRSSLKISSLTRRLDTSHQSVELTSELTCQMLNITVWAQDIALTFLVSLE